MSKNKNKSSSQESTNSQKSQSVEASKAIEEKDTPNKAGNTKSEDIKSEMKQTSVGEVLDQATESKEIEDSEISCSTEGSSEESESELNDSQDQTNSDGSEDSQGSTDTEEVDKDSDEQDSVDDEEEVLEEISDAEVSEVKSSVSGKESLKSHESSKKEKSSSDKGGKVETDEDSLDVEETESGGIAAWFKNQMTPKGALVLSAIWIVVFIGLAVMYQPQMKGYNGSTGESTAVSGSASDSPMNVNGQRLQLFKHFTKATITNQYGTDAAEISIPPYFKEDTTAIWDNYTLVCQEQGTEFFAQFISMQEGVASADVFDSFGEGMKTVSTDFTEVTRSENHIVFTVTMNDEKVRGRFEIVKGNRPDSFIEVTLVSSNPDTKVDDVELAKYVKLVSVPDDMKEQAEKDLEAYMNAMLESTMQNMPSTNPSTSSSEQTAGSDESQAPQEQSETTAPVESSVDESISDESVGTPAEQSASSEVAEQPNTMTSTDPVSGNNAPAGAAVVVDPNAANALDEVEDVE